MVRETFQRFRSHTTVETALKSQTERPCTFWVWTWRSCLRRGEKSDSFIELTMWFWQSDKSWIESDCAWYTSMIHFYAPPRCNMVAHGHRGTNYRCFGPTSPLVGLHFHSTSKGCLKQMPKAGDGIAHGVATALTGRFRGMHVTLEEEKRTGEGRWNSIRSPENSKSLRPNSFQSSSTTREKRMFEYVSASFVVQAVTSCFFMECMDTVKRCYVHTNSNLESNHSRKHRGKDSFPFIFSVGLQFVCSRQ